MFGSPRNEYRLQESPWPRTAQLSCSWISAPQKLCEIINLCHFKLQNFRVICYTALDSYYTYLSLLYLHALSLFWPSPPCIQINSGRVYPKTDFLGLMTHSSNRPLLGFAPQLSCVKELPRAFPSPGPQAHTHKHCTNPSRANVAKPGPDFSGMNSFLPAPLGFCRTALPWPPFASGGGYPQSPPRAFSLTWVLWCLREMLLFLSA